MKVTRHFCDRCGKEFSLSEVGVIEEMKISEVSSFYPNFGVSTVHNKEFCKECSTSFQKWLTMKRGDSND